MNRKTTILSNQCIAAQTYEMKMTWDQTEVQPGQFLQIRVPGVYLRRPISICECDGQTLTIVYKVVGKGTGILADMQAGESLDILGPLGNGFRVEPREQVTLVAGGVGVPPMVQLAKEYQRKGVAVHVVLGFNEKAQSFYTERFSQLGADVWVATMDGSLGTKGTVIDCIEENGIDLEYVQSCGPLVMLKEISKRADHGQVSLEQRMACGMGACMGCVIQDQQGKTYRVCKDGPVFPLGKGIL